MALSTFDGTPILDISLELSQRWAAAIGSPSGLEQVRGRVERSLTTLLGTLGLPGQARVEIGSPIEWVEDADSAEAILLTVGGLVCRFSSDVVLRALSYVERTPLVASDRLDSMLQWLEKHSTDIDGSPGEPVGELIALICREAVVCQPSLLLTREQTTVYAASVGVSDSTEVGHLHSVLQRVIGLGISLGDRETVQRILSEHGAIDSSEDTVAEKLVSALTPPLIELRIEPGYLRQITLGNMADGPDKLQFLREGLFTELGLTLPGFHFVPDPSLAPLGFAITINHLTLMPQIGLESGSMMVNETVERLPLMGISGAPISIPATIQPGSLVDEAHRAELDAAGLTTWPQLDYLVLCLAADLRRTASMLITRSVTDKMLERLASVFPALEEGARATLSLDALTTQLRSLIAEEISIRNLRRIIECLIESEVIAGTDSSQRTSAIVRGCLREQIANDISRSTGTLVAYLLDPAIEAALQNLATEMGDDCWMVGDNDLYPRLRRAIIEELQHLPPNARVPSILTTDDVRPVLSTLLKQEFPRIRTVAYGDLPLDFNVQPVARLSWI